LARGSELRGVRQARAIAVRQVVYSVHDPGRSAHTATEPAASTELGDLDLVDYIQVHPLLRYDKQRNEQKKHGYENGFS
jgi:hypothetical protein